MGYSTTVDGYKVMFTKRRSEDPNSVAYNYAGAPWRVAKRFDTVDEAVKYMQTRKEKLGATQLFKIETFGKRV